MLLLALVACHDTVDVVGVCHQLLKCADGAGVDRGIDACIEIFEADRAQSTEKDCGSEHDAWLVCIDHNLQWIDVR